MGARALVLDPHNSKIWYLWGTAGGGELNGKHYTEKECYEQALDKEDGTSAGESAESFCMTCIDKTYESEEDDNMPMSKMREEKQDGLTPLSDNSIFDRSIGKNE